MRLLKALLNFLIAIGLAIGILGFLLLGLVDITGLTMGGSIATTTGIIALMLCGSNAFGFQAITKGPQSLQIAASAALIVLSLALIHFSPVRLGSFFGYGDPVKILAFISIATGVAIGALIFLEHVAKEKVHSMTTG